MTRPATALFLLLLVAPSAADDWPHWRGPARTGISAETGWLDKWPAGGPKVLWKTVVGTGFSSFAVADGRLYTVGNRGDTDVVFCLNVKTGRAIWAQSYPSKLDPNLYEGGPNATPTVDGDRVYMLGRWGDLFCYDAATGDIVWKKNVTKEFDLTVPSWGFSGSPLVHEDLLILNVGDAGIALEKATGRTVWRSDGAEAGYSTPLPIKRGGAWQILLASKKSYLAVDARTGKEAWRFRWPTQYGCNIADPIVSGDLVFISSGYNKGAALLRLGAGEPEELWRNKTLRNQINSSVLIDGHLYGLDGNMASRPPLKCLELKTGREKWADRGIQPGSLIAADGKLIVLSTHGELMVAPASPGGFRPTARAKVLEGRCWTAPVLSNGLIFCRNAAGRTVCLDVRKP